MIEFQKALELAKNAAFIFPAEQVHFMNSLGRVLAEDIFSDVDMPPFDKSAMDGYACKKEDLLNPMEVIEIIPAGKIPNRKIEKGQCAKIMTGGVIPAGADTVIIVEHTQVIDANFIQFTKDKTSTNICFKGEDVVAGQIIVSKGTLIDSRHISMIASVGAVKPLVYKKPKIGIIVTGDELVEPEIKPTESLIRNSNAYSIISQCNEMGINPIYYGICSDNMEEATEIFIKAKAENDVIIFSGAVSMGDFDFIPTLLSKHTIEIVFHGMNVKPGKRLLFGKSEKKWFIGLPGNPVSVFIQFNFFAKPFLYQLMGHEFKNRIIKMEIAENYQRKSGIKLEFLPAMLTPNGEISLSNYHGSAHINAIHQSDCVLLIEPGTTSYKKGEKVNAILF